MQCPDCLGYRHEGPCTSQTAASAPAVRHDFSKPCPFCGTDPGLASSRFINSTTTIYNVGCEDEECAANPQVSGFSLKDALTRWNTRVGK